MLIEKKMNFIFLKENSYPKIACEQLIDFFENNKNLSKPGGAGKNILQNLELSLTINRNDAFWGLGDTIMNGVKEYLKEYKLFHECLPEWGLDQNIQLCKFKAGKNYNFIHCENDGNPDHMKRILAWMLNLNDIKEGGETQFIYQNFKTNPKAGNLYIWPAGATHMHKGITAPNEDKYFVSGWFVFK